jgi:hypothetical protein
MRHPSFSQLIQGSDGPAEASDELSELWMGWLKLGGAAGNLAGLSKLLTDCQNF